MTEKSSTEDLVNEDDFLSFSEIAEEEAEYPEYDTSRAGEREWDEYSFPAGGKTLVMYHDEWGTFWSVKWREGGELPPSLSGKFTDEQSVKLAIQLYIASKD